MIRGMHHEDIKAAIRKKGTTLCALSEGNGLSESAIRQALRKPCPRANKVISEFIGKPLHEIWPAWFDKQGQRIRPSSISKDRTRKPSTRHRQK